MAARSAVPRKYARLKYVVTAFWCLFELWIIASTPAIVAALHVGARIHHDAIARLDQGGGL